MDKSLNLWKCMKHVISSWIYESKFLIEEKIKNEMFKMLSKLQLENQDAL
jgi:hypothetical protein